MRKKSQRHGKQSDPIARQYPEKTLTIEQLQAVIHGLESEVKEYKELLSLPYYDLLMKVLKERLPPSHKEYGIRNVVHSALVDVERFKQTVKTRYDYELGLKKGFPWKSKPYIQADRQVWGRITRTRIKDVMDYSYDHKNYRTSEGLCRRLGLKPLNTTLAYNGTETLYDWDGLVQFNYEHMAKELSAKKDCSVSTAYRTVAGIVRIGWFENMGKAGERESDIIKIGVWRWYYDARAERWRPRFEPLLNKTNYRNAYDFKLV